MPGGPPESPVQTLFIADSYNGLVRMVGPDGLLRIVSDESGAVFGAPSRVAYAPERGWLYVADSMGDKLVALTLPRLPDASASITAEPAPQDSESDGP